MISSFRSMSFPLFALIAALAGCSGEAGSSTGANVLGDISSTVTTTQASAPNAGNTVQPTAKNAHHKRHSHRGSASLVRTALRAPINLSAEQRTTIEGLLKSNKAGETSTAKTAHVRTFDATRAATLAAAVRNNSVESIPAPVKQVKPVNEAAREARIAASASKLQTLHDTLTPAQRTALVDAIEARANQHGQKNAKQGERVQNEKKENNGERIAKRAEGRKNGLFAGLDLTQTQKDALHAKLASMRPAKPSEEQREAMKARFTAMRAAKTAKLETFKGDSFDAKSFVTPVKQDKPVAQVGNAGSHVNRRAQMLAALTSILDPAQREKLATRIEQGPARMQVKNVAN